MSIKLNGNQIAGAPGLATTNRAGIVRMASDEDIKQGTNNTSFVTPKQLNSYCGGLELCDIGMALYVDETKGKRRYLNGSTMFIHECYEPFLKRLQEIIALYPNLSTTEENWQSEASLSAYGQVGKFVISESTYYGFSSGESVVYTDSIEDGRVKVYTPDFVLLGEGIITSENLAYNITYTRNNNDKTMTKVRLPKVINVQGLTDLSQAGIRVPAGLPTLTTSSTGAHTHTRGTMDITGEYYGIYDNQPLGAESGAHYSGAFYKARAAGSRYASSTANGVGGSLGFQASKNWTGETSSNGAHTHTIAGTSDTVQPEAIQYPYFIQVATGQETTANVKNELQLNNPFFFGYYQYFETAPNNISWLKSEGQWNSKAVYPDYYDWILTNANNGVANFKLSTDTYDDYAWVINTADETFRLPIKTKNAPFTISGAKTTLSMGAVRIKGNGKALGLSNINRTSTGSLKITTVSATDIRELGGTMSANCNTGDYIGVDKDASKSGLTGSVSGTATTTVSTSENTNVSLYFYVGETVQNVSIINIGRVQEEVSNKLDKASIYYDEDTQTLVIEG